MKRDRMMVFFLATGLVLGTSVRGVTTDGTGNPYQGVVVRNVFALKPAPDPAAVKPPVPEPPKIIPQGIMSVFGRQQVLFKTIMPGSKPGEPPKETAMVLSVGERAGEIEVVAIDESAGTITFNNHGKPQTLSLEKDGPKPPTGPAVAPFPGISVPGTPGVPAPAAFNPSQSGAAAGSALKNIPTPTRSLHLLATTAGVTPLVTQVATPPPGKQQTLAPEEQAALILINREQAKSNPGPPLPFPPIEGISE